MLYFGGCIPYGICSDPWLVQYTNWVLHVVPMMFYPLAYFVLLILSLMGLVLCGCSQILQICGCNLIGGDELFIVGVNSE